MMAPRKKLLVWGVSWAMVGIVAVAGVAWVAGAFGPGDRVSQTPTMRIGAALSVPPPAEAQKPEAQETPVKSRRLLAKGHHALLPGDASETKPMASSRQTLPKALRVQDPGSLLCDLRADVDPHIEPIPPGEPRVVSSPAVSFATRPELDASFDEKGLAIRGRSLDTKVGAWTWSWSLTGVGREGNLSSVDGATPNKNGNHTVYERGGSTEWYEHRGAEIEQGFTVPKRPEGDTKLVIEAVVAGELTGTSAADGDGVVYRDALGREALRYAKLQAQDAAGRSLPARIDPDGGRLRLVIDDRDAVYPVEIDPLIFYTDLACNSIHEGECFGLSVAGAGDVNGDGYADVLIGGPGFDSVSGDVSIGEVGLCYGPVSFANLLIVSQSGFQEGSLFGWSVSGAGDVNGDGYDDIIVGAPYYDKTLSGGEVIEDAGAFYVFLGGAGGTEWGGWWVAPLSVPAAYVGDSVARVGDVNGDGYADVAVGARGCTVSGYANGGIALVYYGSPSGLTLGMATGYPEEDANFGICVAGAGDVNADGYADVLVGAPGINGGETPSGFFFVFNGSSSGVSTGNAGGVSGDQDGAWLGFSVASAGDVNGDGYSDVIAGAPWYSNGETDEGRAYVYFGGAEGLSSTASWYAEAERELCYFGYSVACAGDAGGDGYADVLIGTPYYSDDVAINAGCCAVYEGSRTGCDANGTRPVGTPANADTLLTGGVSSIGASNEQFGFCVTGVGDLDGDGFSNIAVGAPRRFLLAENAGGVNFYHGAPGTLSDSPAWSAQGETEYAEFGWHAVGIGDANGDGYDDFAVGAHKTLIGETGTGRVYVYYGSPDGPLPTPSWVAEDAEQHSLFGASVGPAGDVNGDGYADLLVGATLYLQDYEDEGRAFLFYGSSTGFDAEGARPVGSPVNADWASLPGGQVDADLGSSTAALGDVNGDGYADIAVSAFRFDVGEGGMLANAGRIYVYYGSAAGLSLEPAWVLDGDYAQGMLGFAFNGAGDVNGDGYADLIIGDYKFSKLQGRALLFYGSPLGFDRNGTRPVSVPSDADWLVEGNTELSAIGFVATGAGDVNNDGFDDVLVTSVDHSTPFGVVGLALVYHGSATGPSLEPDWRVVGDQSYGDFGWSAACADDVNGDGYDDVIIGSDAYTQDIVKQGRAALYRGSIHGLETSPAWRVYGGSANETLGNKVAPAGDVNGDGYVDILVGSRGYANGTANVGLVQLYLGNDGRGMSICPGLRRSDGVAAGCPGARMPMDAVEVTILSRSPLGRMPVRLEYEVKAYGRPFDGEGTLLSDWVDSGLAGHEFAEAIEGLGDANGFRVRMRVCYDAMRSPGFPHSRWYEPVWSSAGPSDFRISGYLPPTDVAGIAILPESPTTTDDLLCQMAVPAVSPADPPRDLEYEYQWSKGAGAPIVHQSSSQSDTLSSSVTRKGETWSCSVRAWDGVSYSHSAALGSATIVNTPPGVPVVDLPQRESNDANLVCRILEVSPDPDVDPMRYTYMWHVKREGFPEFPEYHEFAVNGPTSSISNQINFTDTQPGDVWYCRVSPYDGQADGAPAASTECVIVQGGVTPSYIFLSVAGADTVTLGETLTVSGQIVPLPAEPDKRVRLFSTRPDTAVPIEFPEDVAYGASTGQFTRTFWPDTASEGRASWSMFAHWNGDNIFSEADSLSVSFDVLKAQPSLTLDLNVSSVPLGFEGIEVTATLTAALPPELSPLLGGRPVKLYMKKPDGSSPAGVPIVKNTAGNNCVTFGPDDFAKAGIAFDTPGTWQFLAEFDGDNNFLHATSTAYDEPESVRLTVKDRAGYAVLVLGKLNELGEGHAEHAKALDSAYRAFRDRGFAEEDIYCLREGPEWPAPDIHVDDTTPTQADVQTAIASWALDKMNEAAAPLYVVFVDHGSDGEFYVYAGAYDETAVITPAELAGWFDALESGLDTEALGQDRVFLYGGCHSGSFVPTMSAPGRTVITSCRTDEVSHRGVLDPADGLRSGEVFLTEFFREARDGKTFKDSFDVASERVVEYTLSKSSNGFGFETQHPVLDDNGDGAGTCAPLSYLPGFDGAVAHELTLGYGANAAASVSWAAVSPTRTLASGEAVGVLEAKATQVPAAEHAAWVEVKTPAYAGSTVADPTNPDSQQVVDMPTFAFEPGISDLANGFFRWETFGGLFDAPGTYQVFYYVQDADTEEVSSYMLTTIYREAAENLPPPAVTLVLPHEGFIVRHSAFFAWTGSVDPNGDPVTYRLELAEDAGFTTDVLMFECLTRRTAVIEPSDGLQDYTVYYWRVIPFDTYGASPATNPVGTFVVDFDNSDVVDGWVRGRITDAATGLAVAGAAVSVPAVPVSTTSDDLGEYFFEATARTAYAVNVSADGYAAQNLDVSVLEGMVAEFDMRLIPLDAYHSADIDEDWQISATEIGRVVGFYNAGSYCVNGGTADGYAPGAGLHDGPPHDSDYLPENWAISAPELSRLVTFYNAGGYCVDAATQDGFAPILKRE